MELAEHSYDSFIDLCQMSDNNEIHLYCEKVPSVTESDENGVSLLHIASSIGTENIIKILLSKGAQVNQRTRIGWTPLMCAARNGRLRLVQLLVDHGADISLRNKLGISVLSVAAANGSKEVIKFVLDTLHKGTLLQDDIVCALHVAALYGNSEALQELLESHSCLINTGDKYGITALMLAAVGGHEEATKILLQAGADSNIKNSLNYTALDIAFTKGYKFLVCLLKESTKKDYFCNDNSHEVGSDLIEQYGWSSVCTPKQRKSICFKNSQIPFNEKLRNELNCSSDQKSKNQSISSHNREVHYSFVPIFPSLFNYSPIFLSSEPKNSAFSEKKSLFPIPVPPVSPYNFSTSPFHFPSTIPKNREFPDYGLNVNNPYNLQLTSGNLSQDSNRNKEYEVEAEPHVERECNDTSSDLSEDPNRKFWRARKVEKWLQNFVALWRKKGRVKNSKCDNQEKSFPQASASVIDTKPPIEFQDVGRNPSEMSKSYIPSMYSTLNNLLISLKLEAYIPLFQEHEVDIHSFFTLKQDDLEEMGIKSPKTKTKLLEVITTLN